MREDNNDNNLVKETKIKSYAHEKGYRVSSDYLLSIENALEQLIDKSISRASLNKRTTLLKQDI